MGLGLMSLGHNKSELQARPPADSGKLTANLDLMYILCYIFFYFLLKFEVILANQLKLGFDFPKVIRL